MGGAEMLPLVAPDNNDYSLIGLFYGASLKCGWVAQFNNYTIMHYHSKNYFQGVLA